MYLRIKDHVKSLFILFGYGSKPGRLFDDDVSVGYMVRGIFRKMLDIMYWSLLMCVMFLCYP